MPTVDTPSAAEPRESEPPRIGDRPPTAGAPDLLESRYGCEDRVRVWRRLRVRGHGLAGPLRGYEPGRSLGRSAHLVGEPRKAEPETAEVESAALLANESAERLPDVDRETLHKLADRFIAEGKDGGAEIFVPWARRRLASTEPGQEP